MRALLIALALPACFMVNAVAPVRVVTKIINSLQEMQDALQKEGKHDADDMFAKNCWCTAQQKELTTKINEGINSQKTLSASVAENKAIFESEGARQTAKNQDMEDFTAKRKTIQAADAAAKVKFSEEETTQDKLITALDTALKQVQQGQVNAQTQAAGFLQISARQSAPAGEGAYASKTGAVSGALAEMLRDNKDQKAEDAAAETERAETASKKMNTFFELANAAASAATSAGAASSAADATRTADQSELNDVIVELANNKALLADTEKSCKEANEEFNQRVKDRMAELESLGNGLNILQANKQDMLDKTREQAPTLMQTTADLSLMQMRMGVAKPVLNKYAMAQLKGGEEAIDKVINKLNNLIEDLRQQQKDQKTAKEDCGKNLRSLNLAFNQADEDEAKFAAQEQGSATQGERLEGEIKDHKKKISDMLKNIKAASIQRTQESNAYQNGYEDQATVIRVISDVEKALSASYETKGDDDASYAQNSAGFIQLHQSAVDLGNRGEPLATQANREKSNSGAVMQLIANVRQQGQKEQYDMNTAEIDARKAYQEYVTLNSANIAKVQDQLSTAIQRHTQALQAEIDNGDKKTAAGERKESNRDLLQKTIQDCKWVGDISYDYATKSLTLGTADYVTNDKARSAEIQNLLDARAVFNAAKERYAAMK